MVKPSLVSFFLNNFAPNSKKRAQKFQKSVMRKLLLSLTIIISSSTSLFAQSGTLSPYSMYGLGSLIDQSNGASRGMNGVGQAFREGNQINYLNPASYSSVDSLTFIFDVGMSLQRTIFKEGTTTKAANVADFEYFIAGFRAARHLGMAFGILPYTDMGFGFESKQNVNNYAQYPYDPLYNKTTQTTNYSSDGGLHEVFLGIGWEPVKRFSIGMNAAFLWGEVGRAVSSTFSDSNVNSIYKTYYQGVHTYKISFGAQYSHPIGRYDNLTVGATVTPGHRLGGDAELEYVSYNAGAALGDTTLCYANGGLSMPTEVAFGVAYKHSNKWKVGLDYSFQNWGSLPERNYLKPNGAIVGTTGSYNNRHKINVGGEWCRNVHGRSFADKIRYRAGVSYTSSYLKINTPNGVVNGPCEISASVGVGLPIINNYNNRSILNIGFQWVNESGSVIRENTFRINLGLTFNERWFAKWKFE